MQIMDSGPTLQLGRHATRTADGIAHYEITHQAGIRSPDRRSWQDRHRSECNGRGYPTRGWPRTPRSRDAIQKRQTVKEVGPWIGSTRKMLASYWLRLFRCSGRLFSKIHRKSLDLSDLRSVNRMASLPP